MTMLTDVSARSGSGVHDLNAIYGMTATLPSALHLADLPWRLASPPARNPSRTRLWETSDGTLTAWAILQSPWHCLDFEVRPGPQREELERTVLARAVERLAADATSRGTALPFYVSARTDDTAQLKAIHRAEFCPDDWSYIHLARDLADPIPEAALPEGFHIRPLKGEAEVEPFVAVHRAAFGSTNMTVDWRRQTFHDPRHEPNLDLVVIGPAGIVAGFCVGWSTPPESSSDGMRVAQVEPFGVLPDHQRIGLGSALLLEVFRWARDSGAKRMEVDAENYNPASLGAYASVGFHPVFEAPFALRVFKDGADLSGDRTDTLQSK